MQAALFVVAHVVWGLARVGRENSMRVAFDLLLASAWSPPRWTRPASMLAARSPFPALLLEKPLPSSDVFPPRWEGDGVRRPLGQMERLLNARRSWSGAMTTAHVSAAILGDDDGARERGDP